MRRKATLWYICCFIVANIRNQMDTFGLAGFRLRIEKTIHQTPPSPQITDLNKRSVLLHYSDTPNRFNSLSKRYEIHRRSTAAILSYRFISPNFMMLLSFNSIHCHSIEDIKDLNSLFGILKTNHKVFSRFTFFYHKIYVNTLAFL